MTSDSCFPETQEEDADLSNTATAQESFASKLSDDAKSSSPNNAFASVTPRLSAGIMSALAEYNYTVMTPVQAAVLPLFLKNKDVCVQAVTGSGKTLAFLIPMIEMILRRTVLLRKSQIGGIVISPTRELARQTHDVAGHLCQHCSLPPPLLLVGGGSGYRPVKSDLESFAVLGSDIVIGTPGRLYDVLSRYSDLQVNELECLILDEADVLLDMGFEVTITNILSLLPKMRRTGLFSATSSADGAVKRLITRAGLRNPVMVSVAIATNMNSTNSENDAEPNLKSGEKRKLPSSYDFQPQEVATPTSLTNYYIIAPLDEKLSRLVSFLRQHQNQKIIVFFLTCASVEFFGQALQQILPSSKFYIELLHGKLNPKRREKAMERFRTVTSCPSQNDDKTSSENHRPHQRKTSSIGAILLCTDIAARGLDVPDIEWTVQFDAPLDPSQYIHRVGRSARAGKVGSSLIFLTSKEEAFVDFLRLKKVPLSMIPASETCAPPFIVSCENPDKESDSSEGRIIRNVSGHIIPDVLPNIRSLVMQDRDLLEKGTKAFTAHIRAYKEHQCAFIFRFASLDLGILATSFCLLRLPKMPELKEKLGKLNFKPAGPEIDIYAIKFKDKVREQARQKRLAAELAAGGKNAKQIKAEKRAAAKLQHQKERRATEIQKGRNPNKKRGKQAQIFDEWEELGKEERLYKKLKRGKITMAEFEGLTHGTSGKMISDRDESSVT